MASVGGHFRPCVTFRSNPDLRAGFARRHRRRVHLFHPAGAAGHRRRYPGARQRPLLGLINGVTFGLLSQLVLDPVLTAFGASEHTLPYARDFMQIILYGLPVTCTMFGLNHIMRATGYPQKAMLSAVLTVGMNIILAPIFIFWLEWGIRGAAIATVLSQCVGMVWVLSHFRNPKSTVHFRQGTFRLRWKIVSSIFSIGHGRRFC